MSSNFDEERVQLILTKEAQMELLQAEISTLRSLPLSTSPSSSSHHGRVQKHQQHTQQRRNNMSRSNSSSGVAPMARHHSSDRIEVPQPRARASSQRSAPPMARGNSKGSTSQRSGNLPFTQNGAMPPPLHSEPRRENPAMMAWTQQEQPLSSYNLSHQPFQSQRLVSQRTPSLEQVRELDDLIDPGDFLRNLGTTFAVSPSISIPSPSTISMHRHSSSFNLPTPSTPTSDMLTNATTLTDSMSRQDSLCNETFLEKMQMMKFPSNSSYSPDVSSDHTMYDQVNEFSSLHSRCSSNEEQSKLLVGAGGASHESPFSHSFPLQSSGSFGAKMEKSQSIESTSSSSSSSSRNVKRLQDQIRLAAARRLIPKGGSADNAMSRENSSQSMARLESTDGSQDNKVAISSKPTYQRPKHDRVYCDQCDSHQEGFRGQHELSRHKDREHKLMVKKWMCFEPTEGHHQVKPAVPLSRCKACAQQKKKYGAYYNAAAHLRRAHFNPKAKGRGKSSKIDGVEGRGGKGGGDWPPMTELKHWMKEVEEQVNDYNDETLSTVADASEEDVIENSIDDLAYSQQSISTMASNSFENNYIADTSMVNTDASMINTYPAAINNDLFGMGGMPLNLSQQSSGGIDQPMFNTLGVQNNFPSFSPDIYQNEQQMFYDNPSFLNTQNVEDQILPGPDYVNHYF